MKRPVAYVSSAVLVLGLAGCTASVSAPSASPTAAAPTPAAPTSAAPDQPTETPTEPVGPPPIEELVLTTEGLGPLVIGGAAPAADDEQALIVYDAEFCTDFGREPGSEFAGLWLPAEFYRTEEGPGFVRAPFGVRVRNDRLERIDVGDESLRTDAGITLGSTAAELAAAYDSVEIVPEILVDLHVVDGDAGKLVFGVAREPENIPGYWEPDLLDTVVELRVLPADAAPYSSAGTDDNANSCPA